MIWILDGPKSPVRTGDACEHGREVPISFLSRAPPLILQVSMKLPMLGGEAPEVPSTVKTKTAAVTHSPENALPMFWEKRKSCMSSDRLSRSPFAFPFRFVGIEKVIVIVSRKLYTEFLSVGSFATSETIRGYRIPQFPEMRGDVVTVASQTGGTFLNFASALVVALVCPIPGGPAPVTSTAVILSTLGLIQSPV